jgi:hypothetical protein
MDLNYLNRAEQASSAETSTFSADCEIYATAREMAQGMRKLAATTVSSESPG